MWRWRRKKLTEEEAAALLHLVSEHYRQPVMLLARFCNAMRRRMRCIDPELYEGRKGRDYYKRLMLIEIDIRKSNLLARLLLGGEKLRTKKCPIHKGHWSVGFGHCEHDCDPTGFLREPEDAIKMR
jgi:hypothetical protein